MAIAFCLMVGLAQAETTYKPAVERAQTPRVIKHVSNLNAYLSRREQYFMEVLTLALDRSGIEYSLEPVVFTRHSESRGIRFLHHGKYDVHWLNTTNELEEKFLPIRIPLFKGLIGWRVLLIRKKDAALFEAVKSIEDLKRLKVLHGLGWPDTKILLDNGFEVETATDFFTLSKMLAFSRGDFFPRGITEIWGEVESYPDETLMVDSNIALAYPAAYYFFVRKGDEELHRRIELGLNRAVEDGSFDEVFTRYFGDRIKRSNLKDRIIFYLPNHNIPKLTPLSNKKLWFTADDLINQ